MYIVVVGCGRVGAELTYRLFREGHEVAVMDQRATAFRNLPPDYRGRTIEGPVLSEEVLKRAEISRADGVAAVTSSDTVNAVVGHVAKEIYGIQNVVVRNFNPRLLPLHVAFRHRVVSSTVWGADRLASLLFDPEEVGLRAPGAGEVTVFELRVPSSWNGRSVGDVLAGVEATPVTLTRKGRSELVPLEAKLSPEDVLRVAGGPEAWERLRKRLSKEEA